MTTEELSTDITVDDMRAQIARIAELRSLESDINETKKGITKQLESEESRMVEMLKACQLQNFKSEIGTVSVAYRTSVKTPKTPEDRALFFDWLKLEGLFDQTITVNSQSLNGLYRDYFEKAREAGAEDFKIPGLNEETITPILSFRRA